MKQIGKYSVCLKDQLNFNSFSKTYKGQHNLTKEPLMIRIISKSKMIQTNTVKQLIKNDVKNLCKIRGQQTIHYIDIVQTKNHFYIVRKWQQGISIKQIINQRGKLLEAQVVELLGSILKGIFQMIKYDVQHLNLTPQNIICKQNKVKVSDFGLQTIYTKILHSQQLTSTIKSYQIPYRSSQIIQSYSNVTNSKADIWSLGIITYQMLFGKHPWKATMLNEKLEFPLDVSISKDMKNFLINCLIIDPIQRAQWQQIFQSNLLKHLRLPKLSKLKQRYSLILSKISQSLRSSGISIDEYLCANNLLLNNQLTFSTFNSLLKSICPAIEPQQVQYLFTKFDINKDNRIQIKQFQTNLLQFDIFYKEQTNDSTKNINDRDKEYDLQEERQNKLGKLYEEVIKGLKKKGYDLYQLFMQSDTTKKGTIQFNQMVMLMRKIDKTLTTQECRLVFEDFDTNHDRQISFNQFFIKMCSITGSTNGLPI